MVRRRSLSIFALALLGLALTTAAWAQADKPQVKIPDAGVPEIMMLEGKFVRVAYNNEGYVILGYQLANRSVGEEWMLLEVGMTVLGRTPNFTLRRSAISLDMPDGTKLPLPSIEEHRKGDTRALQQRERVQRDSINYFPTTASRACALVFFPELDQRAMPREDVELSSSRACTGRLYFKIPGGVKHGQYWLNVQFEKSLVRVPFRILTEDEEKFLSKNYRDIEKQVKEAFSPKKK